MNYIVAGNVYAFGLHSTPALICLIALSLSRKGVKLIVSLFH